MNSTITIAVLLFVASGPSALAQGIGVPPSKLPTVMEVRGSATGLAPRSTIERAQLDQLEKIENDVPVAQISRIAHQPFSEAIAKTRSAKDAALYQALSPSVVEILTGDGLGSGSLIDSSGTILTNYHVVKGYSDVGIVFKSAVEGREPTQDDIKLGHLVKFDEVADLALIKAVGVPAGRVPIRLGDSGDIAIGADVHAIGHPEAQAWSYTTGVISQYRIGFEWTIEKTNHRADVIQTQTPINHGNSGGPLLGDTGTLIGVNTIMKNDAQNLNFAVSTDDVKKFLARTGNRLARTDSEFSIQTKCKPNEISRSRNDANNAILIVYDIDCSGKANADYVIPDKKTDPILLMRDRNGDGLPDVIYFDFSRQGKWDLSYWDETFEGRWTLVGYHADGSLNPTSFESFEVFQARRLAKR
jgi:S1-C subfamily serine protease